MKMRVAVSLCLCIMMLMFGISSAQAQEITANSSVASRVAPGEELPASVTLVNFGSSTRTDVTLHYSITNANGNEVQELSQTVAVETTASFIKNIPIPPSTPPGNYTVSVRVVYDGQQVPATASYSFSVEQKMAGVFVSDLIVYLGFSVLGALILVLIILLALKRRRASRVVVYDYSSVPKNERIYYEILGDAIQQMRSHQGDRAIEAIAHTPGLVVDGTTGRVVRITQEPSEVIAAVVATYRDAFGKNINLSFEEGVGRAIVR